MLKYIIGVTICYTNKRISYEKKQELELRKNYFIYDCLKNRLKVFTSTEIIACLDFSTSTWFNGYDKKYYIDKGALFYCLHGLLAYLFMFLYLIRHKGENNSLSFLEKMKYMKDGYLIMKEGSIYGKKY